MLNRYLFPVEHGSVLFEFENVPHPFQLLSCVIY